ncbi:hypothetical protein JTE90_004199 [Oedothorax gibbosus]|uniref:Uncharacterized protein n=1 Tax=Oedothorax gibbosus TaxID=931172 RepID=A0AAV6V222_9ARAC|nr:hypothetical protein JTE90_004199 [Oedothorax gibbosus]
MNDPPFPHSRQVDNCPSVQSHANCLAKTAYHAHDSQERICYKLWTQGILDHVTPSQRIHKRSDIMQTWGTSVVVSAVEEQVLETYLEFLFF